MVELNVHNKKDYILQNADRKIKRLVYLVQASLFYMTTVVLYDSVVHNTPLYYIGFYFLGLISGRIYRRFLVIEHEAPKQEITLKVSRWDIVLIVLLFLIRFLFGSKMLAFVHIVWISDALYLFFIGLYRSKWKGIVKQIDEIVYKWASKNNKEIN